MESSARIAIGVVTRPHGVRGAVRVKVFNPETEVLRAGALVGMAAPGATPRPVRVLSVTPGKDTWIVLFEGATSHEAAEALRGAELSVARDELPPAGEGEYYHADLVGCAVRTSAGAPVGTVREVLSYPSVDALVVRRDAGGTVEVPIVDGIVTAVDLATRTIIVDAEALEAL